MANKTEGGLIKQTKKIIQIKKFRRAGLIIGLLVLVLGLVVFGFNLVYKDKILPQTYIGGVNLGGKNKAEAVVLLQNAIGQSAKAGDAALELKYLVDTWPVSAQDLDLNYKVDASVETAWRIGREGNFSQVLKEQLKSVLLGNRSPVVFNYNESKLNTKVLGVAEKINSPEKDATVEIRNLNPIVIEEQTGQKLNFDKAINDILATFGNVKTANNSKNSQSFLELIVDQKIPKVKKAAAMMAADQVKEILAGPIVLKSDKKEFTVPASDYANWISFIGVPNSASNSSKIDLKKSGQDTADRNGWSLEIRVSQAKVNTYIESIAGEINQEPKDAKFGVADGKVSAFQVSQTGYELDKEKSYELISQAILTTKKTVALPVKVIEPSVASNSAAGMGIVELVGEGSTSWRGSPSNRIHNLTLGSEKISGTIVKPGEEFSTVKTIGQIDGSTGFLPELVIKNSTEVVPEFGGGLCQVSTTLFRAVLNSGLKITAREPHSFRVSYYEPPVGMDATIYDPAPDFKFINNMSTPILIWAVPGQNTLDFQIYGTKDGRKIEISDPAIFNYTSPPAPVYTESATMEPGAIRQVERATRGCTASFNYLVTDKAGKELEKDTFVSKYVPLPDSYLFGAGYAPPAPEAPPEG